MLAAHFDNGFFSKAEGGEMASKPMNENPGATSGVHALTYHKTIVRVRTAPPPSPQWPA